MLPLQSYQNLQYLYNRTKLNEQNTMKSIAQAAPPVMPAELGCIFYQAILKLLKFKTSNMFVGTPN